MEALVALRLKVKKIDQYGSRSKRHNNSAVHLTSNKSSADDKLGNEPTGLTSGLQVNEEHRREPSTGGSEVNPNHVKNSSSDGRELLKTYTQKEDPMEVLEHVRITNTLESPISTIKGVFKDSREEELSFDKEELKRVEERLRAAFIQFYHQLQLLKHYSFMNLSAFSKIMKKYAKIASRIAARSYMLIVDNSNVGSSDEVTNLLERVETTFIQKFSNSNRREGMKSLRPKAKRERHSVTFFSGFFSGCSIALLVAIVFPLYSLFGYITLHMLLYAADIYFWRCYRVNYAFIFGFNKGTELGYLEVFLLATGLAVLSLGGFLANLHLDLSAEKYKTVTELVPLGLLACIRRFCDEKDVKYIFNGLKYLSTIVAVIIRTVYEMKKGKTSWMVLALISSAVATTMNTYWDIVMDWGLLRKTSKNKYLRDRLVVPHKIVYFAAMVLNVVLRLAWMQLVLEFKLRTINKMTITTVITFLEVIRRGIWSFFRLENEHLNNVGQYRAFKSVPLPFSYYDEDADKDD